MNNDYVFVLDVDGVVTDSKMYYTKEGKYIKCFGSDDFDLLRELSCYMHIHFITADKKGFEITSKRIEDEMEFKLDLVSHKPKDRWDFIHNAYKNKFIYFMGDGWADWFSLKNSNYGITTNDSLDHVKKFARYITSRNGASRAVAEAILHIDNIHSFGILNV